MFIPDLDVVEKLMQIKRLNDEYPKRLKEIIIWRTGYSFGREHHNLRFTVNTTNCTPYIPYFMGGEPLTEREKQRNSVIRTIETLARVIQSDNIRACSYSEWKHYSQFFASTLRELGVPRDKVRIENDDYAEEEEEEQIFQRVLDRKLKAFVEARDGDDYGDKYRRDRAAEVLKYGGIDNLLENYISDKYSTWRVAEAISTREKARIASKVFRGVKLTDKQKEKHSDMISMLLANEYLMEAVNAETILRE